MTERLCSNCINNGECESQKLIEEISASSEQFGEKGTLNAIEYIRNLRTPADCQVVDSLSDSKSPGKLILKPSS